MKHGPIGLICALILASASAAQPPPPAYGGGIDEALFYFDSGSARVRTFDNRIFPHIASFVTSSPPGWVRVRAHADTLGSLEDNLSLSARRGEAVAKGLVRIGVDPAVIVIVACGESRPAVSTGDEVDEPLNRLATVEWGEGQLGHQETPPCRTFAFQPAKGASAAP